MCVYRIIYLVTTDIFTAQSKECQKTDWRRSHKDACRVACGVHDLCKALGPEMETKYKSFEAWCQNAVSGYIGFAAVSALGLHADWTRLSVPYSSSVSFFILTNQLQTTTFFYST